MERGGCVYFMSNANNNVLYVGVTSDLPVRIKQHRNKEFKNAFTAKYNCNKLVYYEIYSTIEEAIGREKNIKNWKREWKDELINGVNSGWLDLSSEIEGWN